MKKEDPKKVAIGARIKMAREMAGLSQGQVAKLMGLHRPSVTEMEAGNRRVSTDELEQLAVHFDVSTAWLLGEDEAESVDAAKLQLAARELEKLKPEDLDRLMKVLSTIRQEKQS
jgi:transcriptional regulator with XRE-family HTH domain